MACVEVRRPGLTALLGAILFIWPRGTGKTLLGRCIASQLGATFFKIAGSGLIAKWLGEAEKIIHASFLWPDVVSPQ